MKTAISTYLFSFPTEGAYRESRGGRLIITFGGKVNVVCQKCSVFFLFLTLNSFEFKDMKLVAG